ncbi:aminoacyl-tRNA deacylase [Marinomonas sp. 42_23_T18]|nr:aminoacyl-tRNA deacylase [Marinomonas sp. 42_23_T18]
MTPACNLLKKKRISYTLHEYEHEAQCTQFGLEAASKLKLDPASVFKTLMVSDGKSLFVAIIPVTHTLSLKKAAAHFGVKKLAMAELNTAQKSSGYLVGGISPIAQKKALITAVDITAQALVSIYVSGGKRGLDIGLKPTDLIAACGRAQFADLRDD